MAGSESAAWRRRWKLVLRRTRLPPAFALAALGLTALPFLLALIGVDMGAEEPSASAEAIHLLLEWTAFAVAAFTGILAALHFGVHRDPVPAVMGLALLGAGAFDAVHALHSAGLLQTAVPTETLVPATWAAGRTVHAFVLVVAPAFFLRERPARDSRTAARDFGVGLVVVLALAGTALALLFGASSLPEMHRPEAFVRRPGDVLPLAILIVGTLLVAPRVQRGDPGVFAGTLFVSVIPFIGAETLMAFVTMDMHDHAFRAAHLLKILSYAFPLVGLAMAQRALHHVAERQTSRRVREANQRFEILARSAFDVVWEADFESRQLRWNQALADIFGYVEEAGGPACDFTWWRERIHPDDRNRVVKSIRSVIDTDREDWIDEYRFRRADGSYATVLDRGYVRRDSAGRALQMIGTMLDLTPRLEAERRMAAMDRERAAVLAQVADGVIISDADGRITYANEEAQRIHGAEIAGSAAWNFSSKYEVFTLDGDPYPSDEFPLTRAARDGVRVNGAHWKIRRGDGSVVLAEGSAAPLRDDEGRRIGAVLTVRDVTERFEMEGQLRSAQRLEAVGRLAGGVAHDFNNLLTVISGNVELLLAEHPSKDDLPEELEAIADATEKAALVTSQLLAFARRQIVQPRIVRVGEVVERTTQLLERLLGDDVRLQVDTGDDAPDSVRADPGQLEQVLLNLAVNARDAMPKGGELYIAVSGTELHGPDLRRWPDLRPGSFVVLEVRDTGVGMDETTVQRIFEPFFTTKGPEHGTGLGLATTYGIVKQSSGEIEVDSSPGHGTTFRILLPRVAPGEAGDASATEDGHQRPADRGSERILLLEDEDDVRRVTVKLLERLGYRVESVTTPSEALTRLQGDAPTPDLLVFDVALPEMSGPELQEVARSRGIDVPVLFISGHAWDAVVEREDLDPETLQFLHKPFAPEELARAVRSALDRED